MARLILAGVGLLLSQNVHASLAEYTENASGDGQIALGFPVPQAQDSSTAFAGFRSYASLIDALSQRALGEATFGRHVLGSSLGGREIYGFNFGQPVGSAPAMLQIGAVHAREWASPEAVTHVAESLLDGMQHNGLERYLADCCSILLAPVINPDALIATQQQFATTRVDEDPGGDPDTPRDGRQRRKNLRDTDGQLDTGEDTLLGVDLNRNIGRFWNTPGGSSNSPASIVYHGGAEASEPETGAVKAAAGLLGADQLRLFIDSHSFGRVHFYNDTGNSRLRTLTRLLAQQMGRVAETDYSPVQEPSQSGIGANDEYFAYEFEIPSFTLEIEPGLEMQAAEYGGNPGVSHSGFILPEAEIARVRQEVHAMSLIGFYHQAGPPILQAVEVVDSHDDSLVLSGRWRRDGDKRVLEIDSSEVLRSDRDYRLTLHFDKPMRWQGTDGEVAQYPGQNVTLTPFVELRGNAGSRQELGADGQWQSARYTYDSFSLRFRPDAELGEQARIAVNVRDLSAHGLDANPATVVNWGGGHWGNYEDGDNRDGDSGGTDSQFCLRLAASAPRDCDASGGGGGGSGSLGLWLTLLLLTRRRPPH